MENDRDESEQTPPARAGEGPAVGLGKFVVGLAMGIIPLVIAEVATFGFSPIADGLNGSLLFLGVALYFVELAFALMLTPDPRLRRIALGAILALLASSVIYPISCTVRPHLGI